MSILSLSAALRIPPGMTAIIGGGGKTTLMFALARELSIEKSVIIGATTKIWPPHHIPIADTPEKAKALLLHTSPVCVGNPGPMGKLILGMDPNRLLPLADHVLLEADGSHGLPWKLHGPQEPVIPPEANFVVAVAGLSGIGLPVGKTVHRPEVLPALRPASRPLTVDDGLAILSTYPKCDVVVLNQGAGRGCGDYGRAIARELPCRVVIAELQKGLVLDCFEEGYRC